ncbi:MAG: hypothetical protein ACJAXS_001643 [Colwellia sp.]|jgi:hypothetical protein
MKIEVSCEKGEANKAKGDLFEHLSRDLLKAQNYEVIEEVRVTGSELDLLCKHNVSNKEIYVECKAQKDKISAPIISKLLGTVFAHDYQEGWLVSTSDFGKDAQGLVDKISRKPIEEASKYSFYTPVKVINSLVAAGVIVDFPRLHAENLIGKDDLGSVTLLISKYGRYWAIYTLKGGSPFGVLIYSAKTGKQITETDTLRNLEKLDSTISKYDLMVGAKKDKTLDLTKTVKLPQVVEVQIGDSWDDYRPARPKDFVGRDDLQKDILSFLGNINTQDTSSRIFAITGNSGLGKSSLIAKLRDRSRNIHYRKKYFVFAVDIRGARSPSYIIASMLEALRSAQKAGFGNKVELKLTDPDYPLSSESIQNYLASVADQNKVICLIFDQFEELYSKPELFSIFEIAKSLMFDVAGLRGSLALGFAWKTDSTTHQDHPAYHMWHSLSDLRKTYRLDIFNSGEISKSITTFEKEFDQKLTPDIRHQISYVCQGFPWLLKKLCINLRESYKRGDMTDISLVDLDVSRLFLNDLELLSPSEKTCLDLIAQKAPADWSEIIELSSVSDVSNLVNKRMVVRSGDRLNIYWDIFKDYLITGKVPAVPYNYIPTSDFFALMSVAKSLNKSVMTSSADIALELSKTEKTVLNIGADLVMLGIAERSGSTFKVHHKIDEITDFVVLSEIRNKFLNHTLKLKLFKNYAGKIIDYPQIHQSLKESLPKAQHSEKTWAVYGRRLAKYLQLTGFLSQSGSKYVVKDSAISAISSESFKQRKRGKQTSVVFAPAVSPFKVIKAFDEFKKSGSYDYLENNGYKSAVVVLKRFEILIQVEGVYKINDALIKKHGGAIEALWVSAKNEQSIIKSIDRISVGDTLSGLLLGEYISDEYKLNWKKNSKLRGGNSLRQWSFWIKKGIEDAKIPALPGRSNK